MCSAMREIISCRCCVSVSTARADAAVGLGDAAGAVEAEGRGLDWRDAAAYARRARGERRRPRHGRSSLTPTEQQVVDLVVEGLTNPQIAERLLMGRATVAGADLMRRAQTGYTATYALTMLVGAVLLVGFFLARS